MKIFITGGSGLIGGTIKEHLLSTGAKVYSPTHLEWPVERPSAYMNNDFEALVLAHGTLGHIGMFRDMKSRDWLHALDVNFFGSLSLIQAAPEGCKIIALMGGGTFNHPCLSGYFAAKSALRAMIPSLACEGYKLVGIAPGPQPSKMIREALASRGAAPIEPILRDILEGKTTVPLDKTLKLIDKVLDPGFNQWGKIFIAREQT